MATACSVCGGQLVVRPGGRLRAGRALPRPLCCAIPDATSTPGDHRGVLPRRCRDSGDGSGLGKRSPPHPSRGRSAVPPLPGPSALLTAHGLVAAAVGLSAARLHSLPLCHPPGAGDSPWGGSWRTPPRFSVCRGPVVAPGGWAGRAPHPAVGVHA